MCCKNELQEIIRNRYNRNLENVTPDFFSREFTGSGQFPVVNNIAYFGRLDLLALNTGTNAKMLITLLDGSVITVIQKQAKAFEELLFCGLEYVTSSPYPEAVGTPAVPPVPGIPGTPLVNITVNSQFTVQPIQNPPTGLSFTRTFTFIANAPCIIHESTTDTYFQLAGSGNPEIFSFPAFTDPFSGVVVDVITTLSVCRQIGSLVFDRTPFCATGVSFVFEQNIINVYPSSNSLITLFYDQQPYASVVFQPTPLTVTTSVTSQLSVVPAIPLVPGTPAILALPGIVTVPPLEYSYDQRFTAIFTGHKLQIA